MPLTDRTTTTGATATVPPVVQIFTMWQGALVSRMLRTVTEHGIVRLLLDGPRTTGDLAREAGVHAPSLHRVLRAMTGLGVFSLRPEGWVLTPLGQALADVGPHPTWADAAVDELPRAVATGTTGMALAHGRTVFEYFAEHPDAAAAFNQSQAMLNTGNAQAVADAYDFAGIRELVDVGGGNGTFLAEVLQRHPNLHGVLFDLPATIAQITPALTRFDDRFEAVGGDFFDAVPAGADAYLLSHVVHDWDEQHGLAILRNVRDAIAEDGRILLVEMVVPPDDAPHPSKMLDVLMLALTGGMERTELEYAELVAHAGFRLDRVIPTRSPVSVLEARPV